MAKNQSVWERERERERERDLSKISWLALHFVWVRYNRSCNLFQTKCHCAKTIEINETSDARHLTYYQLNRTKMSKSIPSHVYALDNCNERGCAKEDRAFRINRRLSKRGLLWSNTSHTFYRATCFSRFRIFHADQYTDHVLDQQGISNWLIDYILFIILFKKTSLI